MNIGTPRLGHWTTHYFSMSPAVIGLDGLDSGVAVRTSARGTRSGISGFIPAFETFSATNEAVVNAVATPITRRGA